MLIVLREINFSRYQHDTDITQNRVGVVASNSCFAIIVARQDGVYVKTYDTEHLLRKSPRSLCYNPNTHQITLPTSSRASRGQEDNYSVACPRRSDGGDGVKRCEQRKKQTLFTTVFFFLALFVRAALSLSERLEQLTSVALMSRKENV